MGKAERANRKSRRQPGDQSIEAAAEAPLPHRGRGCLAQLGGGANADIAAALELETITLDQVMCPGQIKEKGLSRIGDEADAAAVPVEIGKGYRIDRGRLRPISSVVNRDRSSHQYRK